MRKFFGFGEEVIARPDLNLTHVANEWLSHSAEDRKKISEEKRRSLNIKAKYVIVVLATTARNYIANEFDYPLFENCWLKILEYLKHHLELHVIVKGHPKSTSNYNAWLSAMASRQEVPNISVLSGPLEEVVGWADLVIDLGKPGTATVVTLLFGKPLLLYSTLFKFVGYFSGEVPKSRRVFYRRYAGGPASRVG